MSYTNVELIRQYLATPFPTRDRFVDQLLVISSDDYLSFYSGAVTEGSLSVKSLQSNNRTQQQITLQTGGNIISSTPIVRGSVVVASDSSLTTVYIENDDYVIDYEGGSIAVKSGGMLAVDMSVVVWHLSYVVYESGVDYLVDVDGGRLKRYLTGDIALNETVFLDYTPMDVAFNDDILQQAVVEANGLVETDVDPDRVFGADPVLQAAATYRAVEIICYTAAARALSNLPADDKAAQTWAKLGDRFLKRSEQLLQSFHPPVEGLSSPTQG